MPQCLTFHLNKPYLGERLFPGCQTTRPGSFLETRKQHMKHLHKAV